MKAATSLGVQASPSTSNAADAPMLDAVVRAIAVLEDAPSVQIGALRSFCVSLSEQCGVLLSYLKSLGSILASSSNEPGASYHERKHALLELSKRLISVFARIIDQVTRLSSSDALIEPLTHLVMKTKDVLVRTLREANMKIDQLSSSCANPDDRAIAPYTETTYRDLMRTTLDLVRQLVSAARQLKTTLMPTPPTTSPGSNAPVSPAFSQTVSSAPPPRPSAPHPAVDVSGAGNPIVDAASGVQRFKSGNKSQGISDSVRTSASLIRRMPRFSGHSTLTNNAEIEWPAVVQPADARFVVEDPSDEFETAVLELHDDIYGTDFYPSSHLNFVGLDKEGASVAILSVQTIPQQAYPSMSSVMDLGTAYEALYFDRNGQQRFSIPALSLQSLKCFSASTPTSQLIEELFNARSVRDHKFYEVASHFHDDFANSLLLLTEKHSQRIRHFKLAVLSVPLKSSLTMSDIFAHKPPQEGHFYELLDSLGDRVTLGSHWSKYRGDFDSSTTETTYYTVWKNIEIMFHIAPWLSSEMHRRLIGNDIAVLCVPDAAPSNSPVPFDTSPYDGLGTVPQVFAVAQAILDKRWRLGFFRRPNVKQFGPSSPPSSYLFELEDIKDYLLTKLTNGVSSAFSCPPMNRLNIVPRSAAIADLGAKYPKSAKKPKEDKKKRDGTQEENEELIVGLGAGRALVSRDDNGYSDPFVVLTLGDQKHKSTVIKKSLSPQWDAQFTFSLRGTRPQDVLQLAVFDWNRISSYEYMGEVAIPLSQCFSESGKNPQWYPLISKTGVLVTGDIQLKFTHSHVGSKR